MKFFLTEAERKRTHSTCYHEFSKGRWDASSGAFWKEDSLNIHDDLMISLGLDGLIARAAPAYDPCGPTEIGREQWDLICAKAEEQGGELREAVREVAPWAEENFARYPVFTILGL